MEAIEIITQLRDANIRDTKFLKEANIKIESQSKAIKKLEEEKATLLREISLKNINLIEVEKENNKLEGEKEEFIIHEDRQSSVIAKYYGKTLVQENDIAKLKQQVKELEGTIEDFERFDFLVEVEIGSKKYQEIKGVITSNPTINKNK